MSNIPPFDRLTHPQRAALVSLVSGDSARTAALLASVTERTVRRWRNQAAFQAALAEAQVDFFSACRSHVNASLASAFQVLTSTAGYDGTNKSEQLKAATFLLGHVAGAEMSAKSARREPKSKKRNRFQAKRPGHQRTSPDRSGHQRTPAVVERTPAVTSGPAADVWRSADPAR